MIYTQYLIYNYTWQLIPPICHHCSGTFTIDGFTLSICMSVQQLVVPWVRLRSRASVTLLRHPVSLCCSWWPPWNCLSVSTLPQACLHCRSLEMFIISTHPVHDANCGRPPQGGGVAYTQIQQIRWCRFKWLLLPQKGSGESTIQG